MSKYFKILQTGIDVSKILNQLLLYPDNWSKVNPDYDDEATHDRFFIALTVGCTNMQETNVDNSLLKQNTSNYFKYSEAITWLRQNGYANHARCGFFKLPVGGRNRLHNEHGLYYDKHDRFHLAIQGKYKYIVADEEHIIEPGTHFWFDNQQFHAAYNIDTVERLAFVWDAPKKTT